MRNLESLVRTMQLLKQVHPQLRVAQVEFLLTVAMKPDCSQTELAVECGYTLAAVSRLVDTLGTTGRRDGKGGALGLIQARENPKDDRLMLISLTQKGKNLVDLIEELTYGGKTSGQ
jgi:DNA-binding MarR family transcriptional regulator